MNDALLHIDASKWLSVTEVSRLTGFSGERIRQLIREGKIHATKLNGWRVRPADLNAFIKARQNF